MRHILIPGLVLALAVAGCSSDEPEALESPSTTAATTTTAPAATSTSFPGFEPGTFPANLEFEGATRSFLFTVPESYDGATPMPVIVSLHGAGSTADAQATGSGMALLAAERGYFALHPQADGDQTWNVASDSRDVRFILGLLDQMEANFPLDASRIFVAGLSNGAGLANRLACDHPDRVAGIAGIAGAYDGGSDCSPAESVSVLAVHSLSDFVVPYQGAPPDYPNVGEWAAEWADRNGCGEPGVTENDNGTISEWTNCSSPVALYTLDLGGHTWFPQIERVDGSVVSTTEVILDWFDGLG
jgi:polyhydroxybutyrate depolymerase